MVGVMNFGTTFLSTTLASWIRPHRRRQDARLESDIGIAYVEFLFIAPLLLLAGGVVIYLGTAYLARTSLTSAVGTVRLAYTRAQVANLVPVLDAYIESGTITPATGSLFASNAAQGVNHLSGGYYSTHVAQQVYGPAYATNLRDIPASNIFALAYAYQSLKESIGDHLLFPQDPASCPAGQDCAECLPLHATSLEPSPPTVPPQLTDLHFDGRFAGIQCRVMISSYFGPVIAGLNLISGNSVNETLTFTRTKYFRTAA